MQTEQQLFDLQSGNNPLIPPDQKTSGDQIEETHQIINLFF